MGLLVGMVKLGWREWVRMVNWDCLKGSERE
jgi:hypothetical protein